MKRLGVIGIPGKWSSEYLADTIAEKTGQRLLVDLARVELDLGAQTVRFDGADLTDWDGFIVKKAGEVYSPDMLDRMELLRFLRHKGVRIFSDPDRMIRLVDRLSCTVTLRMGGIPIPPTVITEDVQAAAGAVERFGKAVAKPLYTSKARGMEILEPGDGLQDRLRAFQDAGNTLMYLQKMMELPGRDLGVCFLGGEYLATYSRVSGGNSWNTTTRSGGSYEPTEPGDEIIAMAKQAQDLFGLDFTSVDVAETSEGPIVFEVSTFGGFRGLRDGCGIDAAVRYADHALACLEEGA